MILTQDNYYTPDADREYMSVSQYKNFRRCEAAAVAQLCGEYEPEMTTALLVGSYIDAYFEGTLEEFIEEHREQIMFKSGKDMKEDFKKANSIICRLTQDKLFMEFMSGEKQRIVTAELFGVKWKTKIDSLLSEYDGRRIIENYPDIGDRFPELKRGAIVDLKCMANFKWGFDERTNRHENFITLWGYDIQLAVYQEVYRKTFGVQLPVFVAGCTKEKTTDLELINIPQWRLDECLDDLELALPRVLNVKEGTAKASRCGVCPYCKTTKKLTMPISFDMAGLSLKEKEEYL
ncbi:MAG: PD-(D/E)XK nuclease-like domain-containing protein [Ruminococcus sp.]|nr:PD-(D/E)XK nuclease-like domain-containing protein [Ruminococcus sp.]